MILYSLTARMLSSQFLEALMSVCGLGLSISLRQLSDKGHLQSKGAFRDIKSNTPKTLFFSSPVKTWTFCFPTDLKPSNGALFIYRSSVCWHHQFLQLYVSFCLLKKKKEQDWWWQVWGFLKELSLWSGEKKIYNCTKPPKSTEVNKRLRSERSKNI